MKKVITFVLSVFFTVCLFATEFHISVIDSDIDIPLEGVVLSLSNKAAGPWETDFNGECTVTIDDFSSAVILQAYLPGYAIKKIRLTEDKIDVVINLSIEEVIEGKELVVEKEAYQRADAESGVSVALTKEQIQTTSLIGVIPDVMTTIKTLPGVAYAGSFCQQPSIRGSYPYETACVFDGMYVLQPYHWSGTISIFDPLMVDSVKLSHGIFSAQYGHATAALLDVNSVNPVGDTVKINASISSIQTDIYGQIPITDYLGAVVGLRMSYMNTIPWFYDTFGITKLLSKRQIEKISDYIKMPYMYDYYAKLTYAPTDRITLGLNAFLGMEGLGAHLTTDTEPENLTKPDPAFENYYIDYYRNEHLKTEAKWDNVFGFGALNFKWLPIDQLQFVTDASYNIYDSSINVLLDGKTDMKYSFMDYEYPTGSFKYWGESSDVEYFKYIDSYYIELFQGKVAGTYQLNDLNIFSLGVEELFQRKTFENELNSKFCYWNIDWKDGDTRPEPEIPADSVENEYSKLDGNRVFNTVGYTYWEFGSDTSKLKGELGLRFENYYLKRKDDKISFATQPYFNPRASIQWTPVRYGKYLDKLTLSAGSGVFTKMVDQVLDLTPEYKISKETVKPDRNAFGLLGAQIDFLENFSFQTEAYYKYYMNRFYTVKTQLDEIDENGNVLVDLSPYSNGIGHVAGFDCMLHKKTGRYLDGYLCYSFVFSRYKNPSGYDREKWVDKSEGGDPLGIWYYPYFHRFHTLNAVVNYRPVTGLTLTLSGGVTSGSPKEEWNEQMGKNVYNDKSRYGCIFPVNFRVAYSNYAFTSKYKWELYLGIENMLGMLNKESVLGAIIYAREINLSNIANFDTGIPSTSIGFRISY